MNKLLKITKKFYNDTRYFSVKLALLHLKETFSRYTSYEMSAKDHLEKDHIVLAYLKNKYSEINIELPLISKQNAGKKKIWVLWFQGEENMPAIVTETFRSIRKNSNGHEVVLITKDNLNEFVDVPVIIKQKVAGGKITLAQYSDIIRACLLSKFGGLWIDATVFVTRKIPESVFEMPFFTIKNLQDETDPLFYISVAHLRWTTYVFGGDAHNALFSYLERVLIAYNSTENALIDYLLIDYVIELAFQKSSQLRLLLDQLPMTNRHKEELVLRLSSEYPDKVTKQLLQSETYFFKLTYKNEILKKSDDKVTNFQLLINHSFNSKYGMEEQ